MELAMGKPSRGVAGLWDNRLMDKAAALLERAVGAGTQGYPREVRRRLRVLNVVTLLIILFTSIYIIQHALLDFATYRPVIAINLALIGVALLVPLAHRLHETAGGVLLAGAELAALFAFSAYLGRPAGMQLQYFVFAAAPFVVFGIRRPWLSFTVVLLALVLHLFSWFTYPRFQALITVDQQTLNTLYVIATVTTVGLIAASVYYAYALAEEAQAQVDALLRNILPDSVAERLTEEPHAQIADAFDEASVLFVDLAGFTPLAQELGPVRTVAMLNRIFTSLDGLSEKHGVEKIKTIGDAYMAVSGVPEPQKDHLERLARMALGIEDTVRRALGPEDGTVRLRIGMAAGPVMAGIIGRHKFSYDVWGDTVNRAARMESHGVAGRIQVSDEVRQALKYKFQFIPAPVQTIKGLGPLKAWYLTGEMPPERARPSSDKV